MMRDLQSLPLVISLLLLFSFTSCKESDRPNTYEHVFHEKAKVKTIEVTTQYIADHVEIMGSVQPAKKALISPRISGNIHEIMVAPGSRVLAGDILAVINAEEISAQLQQAQAQLDQAMRNLEREKKLLAQNAATKEGVKNFEDQKKIAQAAHKEALTMLGYTKIKAPFNGWITKKTSEAGDLATPGKPLLHLESEKRLQLHASVPESMVLNIGLGKELQFHIPSANVHSSGKVSEIAPSADTRSRTVPIKIDIPYRSSLRSGQFARVVLPGNKIKTILIPSDSIFPFGQLQRVYLLNQKRARLRLIRTGKIYNGNTEVISGLNPGDRLIISSDKRLSDGQPIIYK